MGGALVRLRFVGVNEVPLDAEIVTDAAASETMARVLEARALELELAAQIARESCRTVERPVLIKETLPDLTMRLRR